MFFRIQHRLSYTYDRPVFLEPMTLRLTPRQDGSQRLLEHQLRLVDPPAGQTRVLEPDGTDAMVAWFQQERDHLTIEVDMLVETLRSNPFDWILTHREAQHLPVAYPEADARSLAGCLQDQTDPTVRAWAQAIADRADGSATAFLSALADDIHHGFHHVGRLEGEPTSAAETLATLTGACRDTAMLFIAACRSQGLAARFVSGYSMHHPPRGERTRTARLGRGLPPGRGMEGLRPQSGPGGRRRPCGAGRRTGSPSGGPGQRPLPGHRGGFQPRLPDPAAGRRQPRRAGGKPSADGPELKPASRRGQLLDDHRCLVGQNQILGIAFGLVTMVEERAEHFVGNGGFVLVGGSDPVAAKRAGFTHATNLLPTPRKSLQQQSVFQSVADSPQAWDTKTGIGQKKPPRHDRGGERGNWDLGRPR